VTPQPVRDRRREDPRLIEMEISLRHVNEELTEIKEQARWRRQQLPLILFAGATVAIQIVALVLR
jgi:hypothetical protein